MLFSCFCCFCFCFFFFFSKKLVCLLSLEGVMFIILISAPFGSSHPLSGYLILFCLSVFMVLDSVLGISLFLVAGREEAQLMKTFF